MEGPAASEHGGVWTPDTGDRRQFCPIFKLLLNFPQSIYNFFAETAFLRTLLNLSHRIRIRLSKTNCKNKFSISQMHFWSFSWHPCPSPLAPSWRAVSPIWSGVPVLDCWYDVDKANVIFMVLRQNTKQSPVIIVCNKLQQDSRIYQN